MLIAIETAQTALKQMTKIEIFVTQGVHKFGKETAGAIWTVSRLHVTTTQAIAQTYK